MAAVAEEARPGSMDGALSLLIDNAKLLNPSDPQI